MSSESKEQEIQAEPDDRISLPRRTKCLTIWLREAERREEEKKKAGGDSIEED